MAVNNLNIQSFCHKEPHWQVASYKHHSLPQSLQDWLLDPSSLTEKLLQRAKGKLRVEVLQQGVQAARLSEYKALNINTHHWAVVREVILYGNEVPWVYARTIIPLSTLKGPLRRLHYLGNKPLGAELFSDPTMRRQSLELASIDCDLLPPTCRKFYPTEHSAWGRRSLFLLKQKPLLVCEFFLEGLLTK